MGKTRIIIVEDNNIISLDLKHCLEQMNYEIISTIPNGEQAISQTFEMKPDIKLMDVNLNGKVNGIEAAEKINSTLKVPILFISAYSDNDVMVKAKSRNYFGYLVKPYNKNELYKSIETLLSNFKNN